MWRSRCACVEVVFWGHRGPSSEGCQCCYGLDDGFLRGTAKKEKRCLWRYLEREGPCPERHDGENKQEVKNKFSFTNIQFLAPLAALLYGWKCWSVQHFVPNWNTGTTSPTLGWFEFGSDGSFRMNYNNFCDHLAFLLAPPSGQIFTLVCQPSTCKAIRSLSAWAVLCVYR